MKFQRPKGTRDLLPEESEVREKVRRRIEEVCESFGYREIGTPTFEHLDLFREKSGQDIVEEVYGFEDKSGRELALRPEVTASIVRAYLQEMQAEPKPIRLHYFTNCFRYEQPQSGRYREFWQFGTEILGGDTPEADAEAIALADRVMRELGLEARLEIGHLGVLRELAEAAGVPEEKRDELLSLVDRGERKEVRELFGDEAEEALGALDVEGEPWKALGRLESEVAGYDVEDSLEEFEQVLEELERHGLEPRVNMGIARGLEYYTGVVFEAYAPGLGAQDQVLGGGSYELNSVFGGQELRSTGFAFGFDRLVEALEAQDAAPEPEPLAVQVAPVTEAVRDYAIEVAKELRAAGVRAEMEVSGRGIGSQISHADSRGADQMVIIGEREADSGEVSLKDMESGEQVTMDVEDAVETLTS